MKRLLLFIAIGFICTATKAQFVYSTVWSDFSPNYILSKGISTSNTPGFLWVGYQPQMSPGMYPWTPSSLNIQMRGYGASSIWTGYKLFDDNTPFCNGNLNQVWDGRGVSLLEVTNYNATSRMRYVMVGAYSRGCYFFSIDAGGTPVASMLYPFPPTTFGANLQTTQPHIIQDDQSNDFYITGSVGGEVYVMKIDASGNLIWSNVYNFQGRAVPNDLLLNSNRPSGLLIVGTVDISANDADGFIMEIDVNTGVCTSNKAYGNPGYRDEFRTIVAASPNNNSNGPGYTVAGLATDVNNVNSCWITRFDLNGAIAWSNYLDPSSGPHDGIIDLLERQNSNSSYEYYALVRSTVGMVVLKLDEKGAPFPISNTTTDNEFVYNLPGTTVSLPASISMVNGPANSQNMGIQVYGTANNITTAATSHMVSAYFNGITNCNRNLQQQGQMSPANFNSNPMPINRINGLNSCSNFFVQVFYVGGAMNFPCTGFNISGDNAKNAITMLEQNEKSEEFVKLFPNPTNGKSTLSYVAEENDNVLLEVSDIMGRKILNQVPSAAYAGEHSVEIDLNALNATPGIYLVKLYVNGKEFRQKLVLSN